MTGNVSKQLDFELPEWAVSDEEIEAAMLPSGWLTDYINYASTVTDAPKAYHYAVGSSILLQALSHVDIRVYTSQTDLKKANGRHYELTTPLWATLVGFSGDRKSFAMDLGLGILRRAVGQEVVLPTDGSIEAWTDYLADHPNLILHREELSFLFSQSRRSYMEGLKDWLLTLHSGHRYDRTTRRRKKATDDKGMEHDTGDNEHVVIERPRVSVLGAITPEVFRTKADALDWSSGFFARFMFVPGARDRHQDSPMRDMTVEGDLAKRLQDLHRGTVPEHPIKIPPDTAKIIGEWLLTEIEPARGHINDKIYSHFTRYLDLGYRLTAAQAASYWQKPEQSILATPKHAKAAVEALAALKDAMFFLFGVATKTTERTFDDEMMDHFTANPHTWHSLKMLDRAFPAYSMRRMSTWCRSMWEDGRLSQKKIRSKRKTKGPKRIFYRLCD